MFEGIPKDNAEKDKDKDNDQDIRQVAMQVVTTLKKTMKKTKTCHKGKDKDKGKYKDRGKDNVHCAGGDNPEKYSKAGHRSSFSCRHHLWLRFPTKQATSIFISIMINLRAMCTQVST